MEDKDDMAVVPCGHCEGSGHRVGSPCCFRENDRRLSLRDAVELAKEHPTVEVVCCSCKGAGQVMILPR